MNKKQSVQELKEKLNNLQQHNKILKEKQELLDKIKEEQEKFKKPSLFSKLRKHITENYEFKTK